MLGSNFEIGLQAAITTAGDAKKESFPKQEFQLVYFELLEDFNCILICIQDFRLKKRDYYKAQDFQLFSRNK